MTTATVRTVNVVHELRDGYFHRTAIDKRPVRGAVHVGPLGLAGDEQVDRSHGGPDRAVYVYADEDAAWWSERLDREIPPRLFGENLRTAGLPVTAARVGEQWRVGEDVVLEVRRFRTPCENLALRMGIEDSTWSSSSPDASARCVGSCPRARCGPATRSAGWSGRPPGDDRPAVPRLGDAGADARAARQRRAPGVERAGQGDPGRVRRLTSATPVPTSDAGPAYGGVVDLDEAVGELYGLHPDEFLPARKGLAAKAKAGKETGLAKAIESIRKPTAAAWAINQLVRARPDDMERLVELASGLHEAQEKMDGAAMKTLGRERTTLIDELVRATAEVAKEGGGSLSMPVANQVRETFVAALATTAAAEAVGSGQLTRALSYAGFGDVDLSEATAAPRPPGDRRCGSSRARARGPGAARDGRPNPSPNRRSRPSRTRRCSSGWPRPRSGPARRCRPRPRPATR